MTEDRPVCPRCNEMHRRAQRLEGIEARIARLRESHAREVAELRVEHQRHVRWLEDQNRDQRRLLDEAKGTLPPPERTARLLDDTAERIDRYGKITSERVGQINGALVADRLRDGAAAIRRLTADTGPRALVRALASRLRRTA